MVSVGYPFYTRTIHPFYNLSSQCTLVNVLKKNNNPAVNGILAGVGKII